MNVPVGTIGPGLVPIYAALSAVCPKAGGEAAGARGDTMRLMKTLGLAAIVVTAFTATVEIGSAMAETPLERVVWCRERNPAVPQTCPNGGADFPAGTEIFAFGGNMEFLTNMGTITCGTSELHMTNTALLVHGNVTALAFGECKAFEIEKCSVTAEHLEYLFKGELMTDDAKYEIRFSEKNPKAIPQLTIECGMLVDCTYVSKTVSIEARLAFTPERLSVSHTFVYSEGLFCTKTMTWDGMYNAECREKAGGELKKCWVKMEFQQPPP
jgi:hypothetical protein